MIKLAHFFGFGHDIVADKRAPEAVSGAIGIAAVDDLTVKKEDIAGIHNDRYRLHPLRQRHHPIGKALGRIGFDRADERQILRAGHDLQATILLVAAINCQPGGHTCAGFHLKRGLILMKRLTTGSRRFEIKHGLDRIGFGAKQRGQTAAESVDPASS